jgi:hypothetical protein
MDKQETSYKRLKSNCNCGCYAHCGFSCMTDDCDCNECNCQECKEKFAKQGKIFGNNSFY